MPLPALTQLPLLPSSRPGDAIHSKPKHAFLIRLSPQTLDALDTRDPVSVEFGDNPTLRIGSVSYPMKSSRESAIHELYLRASSANKKAAPLKLYANVVGQLDVARELQDDLRERIRQSTQDAANERNKRTTVLLETPPDLPAASNPKKRKEPPSSSSMFRKPLRPVDKPKPLPPSSTPAQASKPSAPPARDSQALASLRKRMIQCLAVGERTEEQVVRLLAGSDPTTSARRDVLGVLEQIAEPVAKSSLDKSPRTFCLKPTSWTEARPYEWPGLSEAERTKIARTARQALRALNIPDSDLAWSYVQYRNTGSNYNNPSDPGKSNTTERKPDVPPKRGVSSHDTKEKKAKPKTDTKGDVMMKDESRPTQSSRPDPPARPNPPERRPEPARASVPENKRAEVRKGIDHAGTPPARRPPAVDVKPPKPSRYDESNSTVSSSKMQRQAERAVAPPASTSKVIDDKIATSQRIKKLQRDANAGATSDSDKERSYTQSDRVKGKEKAIKKEAIDSPPRELYSQTEKKVKDKIVKREPIDSPRDESRASASKRKAANNYDDDDYHDSKVRDRDTLKRRKTESVQPPTQRDRERERERARDRDRDWERDVVTKKATTDPRSLPKAVPRPSASTLPSKMRSGHDSMSPPVKRSPSNTSHARYSPDSSISSNLNHSSHSYKSTSTKPRRRSPIYTSSEDEEPPLKTAPVKTRKPSPPPMLSSQSSREREAPSRKEQTDPASLRAKYSSLYFEYLDCFYKVDNQKTKLNNLLRNHDLGLSSDDDLDIMDDEELAEVKGKHDKLRAQLVGIIKSYGQVTKSGEGEPLPAPDMIAT